MRNRARKLVVDERVYRFSVRHLHDVVDSSSGARVYRECRERLTIRREGARAAPLTITFVGRPGHGVGDGVNPSGMVIRWMDDAYESSIPHGVIARPNGVLNLHRPGVARAMLDESIARGWDTVSALEFDGWELFDAVRVRLGPSAFRDNERHPRLDAPPVD